MPQYSFVAGRTALWNIKENTKCGGSILAATQKQKYISHK